MSKQQEPNVYISGDEARSIMQLLMSTPALQLYSKLNEINMVQPLQETPQDEQKQ